jgi:hypothetical protein
MKLLLTFAVVTWAMLVASQAQAQTGFAATEINRLSKVSNPANHSADRIRSNAITTAVPSYGFAGVNALGRAKPFSSISRGPSVTPYLALDQPFSNTATNYYTLIRPQLEQQRINQNQDRQNQLMQRQLSQVASRPPYDPTGSETMAPTGHTAVYMNYGGYYQVPPPRR